MAAPVTPLEKCPKVGVDLKTQLEGFDAVKLRATDTQEKNVLPTAAGNIHKQNLMRMIL